MKITSTIANTAKENPKIPLSSVKYNYGVYRMHGGCSHDGDLIVSSPFGMFYINERGDKIPTVVNEHHHGQEKFGYSKINKKIVLTFENE